MSKDIWQAAEALQNARDHIIIAKSDKINRNYRIDLAMENIRDAIKALGVREAENDGNNS